MIHETHEMHENSLETYDEILNDGSISKRCKVIIEAYQKYGSMTDRDVKDCLNFQDMNAVRPRITEMLQVGILQEVNTILDKATGKPVRVVKLMEAAA
jgi:hypothetical protein